MSKNDDRKRVVTLRSLIKGVLISLFITGLILIISAMLITNEKLPDSSGIPVVVTAALIGAIAGGLAAGKGNGRGYVLCGACVGAVLFLIRSIAAAFNESAGILDSFALKLLAVLMTGGILGGLLAGKTRKKRKSAYGKKRQL